MQVKFWPHDGAIWKKLDDYGSHSNSSWGKTACLNYIFVYYIFNKSINIDPVKDTLLTKNARIEIVYEMWLTIIGLWLAEQCLQYLISFSVHVRKSNISFAFFIK